LHFQKDGILISGLKGLDGFELEMPPWLKALPKVNRVSGGVPKVQQELEDIVTGFNKYIELYQEHVKAVQDWADELKEALDPLTELTKRELALLKKHSKNKEEHKKAGIQARRKLLNTISWIAVSGTEETKSIVKEQLLSCGVNRKDLNKLIDNSQGSLYKNPFSRDRHEAYEINDEFVSNMDVLAFIKGIVSELEIQKNACADLRHHKDWLRIEHFYNTTSLYCVPEQVPIALAKKESIEEYLTLPKTKREAKESNNKYYYTGKKCINGHISPGATKGASCLLCRRERIRVFAKNKYHKTHEKISDLRSEYFLIDTLLLITAKSRAKRKGIKFNLNFDDIEIPEYCPILGIKLDKTWGGVEQTNKQRANKCSLDRIDSKKGYIKGNVIVISYRANMIKGDGSADEHRAIAKYINNETVKYKKL